MKYIKETIDRIDREIFHVRQNLLEAIDEESKEYIYYVFSIYGPPIIEKILAPLKPEELSKLDELCKIIDNEHDCFTNYFQMN